MRFPITAGRGGKVWKHLIVHFSGLPHMAPASLVGRFQHRGPIQPRGRVDVTSTGRVLVGTDGAGGAC